LCINCHALLASKGLHIHFDKAIVYKMDGDEKRFADFFGQAVLFLQEPIMCCYCLFVWQWSRGGIQIHQSSYSTCGLFLGECLQLLEQQEI
jgi:hypothetical protein